MSCFTITLQNRETNEYHSIFCIDDYYAHYIYGYRLPDGTTAAISGFYKTLSGGSTERVSKKDILTGLNELAKQHPELQATLKRDLEIYGPERTYNKLSKTFDAAADAHAYSNISRDAISEYDEKASALYNKTGKANTIGEGFTICPIC